MQLRRPFRRKVSKFGEYAGFTDAAYDSHSTASDYCALADGTRLAYDLILPAQQDTPATDPLPVLLKYTPYLRSMQVFDEDGRDLLSPVMGLSLPVRSMLRLRHRSADDGDRIGPLFRTRWLTRMVR